jgi:SAM-dependent methyltransferase
MRARSLSFGTEAERYDRARPSYPDALVDRLLADGAQRVLDIGCGTGKAARLFVSHGCDVLGVEADERMAAVARVASGVEVEVASFEDWAPRGRTFDLAVCAQAWHWIDPARGIPKAAEALRPGGRIAVFWNRKERDAVGDALDAIYERLAPEIWATNDLEGRNYVDELESADALTTVESWSYEHERLYTRAEWLDVLGTYSDHILLPAATREELFDAVGASIDAQGGERLVRYTTEVITAVRL